MRFRSTRGGSSGVSTADALFAGLAPDGGLFLPEWFPRFPDGFLEGLAASPPEFDRTAAEVLALLLGDESRGGLPAEPLRRAVRAALDFPVPLVPLTPRISVLELFHGPTLAFKDVGARTMARLLGVAAGESRPDQPLTILVATSGDTGGAVASAFLGVPGTRVVVLYPEGQVSPRQEAQFTTLGRNTHALAVRGTFDDCQRIVKEAFADPGVRTRHRLGSANSINAGRLLPQVAYHVYGRVQYPLDGPPVVISIPSGNFGNLAAGMIARRMGLPVDRFVAATNANAVVPDFLRTGTYAPRPSVRTASSAMDVGTPSNIERILDLCGGDVARLREEFSSTEWSDEETFDAIRKTHRDHGKILDPHTAVGLLGLEAELNAMGPDARGIVLSTAHPVKFAEVVEPLVHEDLPLPPSLAALLERPSLAVPVEPTLGAVADALDRIALG